MKNKVHRRRVCHSFMLSRKFAAALIGLFAGLAMGEFCYFCLIGLKMSLVFGVGFGYMLYNFYLGIMQDLQEERERRRTWTLKQRESARRAAGRTSASSVTGASRVRIMY